MKRKGEYKVRKSPAVSSIDWRHGKKRNGHK